MEEEESHALEMGKKEKETTQAKGKAKGWGIVTPNLRSNDFMPAYFSPLVDGIIIVAASTASPADISRAYIQKERAGQIRRIPPVEQNPLEIRFEKAIVTPTTAQASAMNVNNVPVPTQPIQPNAQPIEKTAERREPKPREHLDPKQNRVPHRPVFLRMPHGLNTRDQRHKYNRRPRDALRAQRGHI